MQALHEFCAAGSAGEDDDHLSGPRIAVIIGGGEQAPSQQAAAVDDAENELGIHGQALAKSLTSRLGAALQIRQVRPWRLGVDVVRSQRRDSAPVVDAALQQALVVV